MKQKRIASLASLLFLCGFLYGQTDFRMNRTLTDVNGRIIFLQKAVPGDNAYLFNSNYLDAVVFIVPGEPIAGNKFKLNLQKNKLYYLDSGNIEMEVTSPIKRVEFASPGMSMPVIFEKGFTATDKLNSDNFYQVLVQGKALLLQDTKFMDVEKVAFGTAATITVEKITAYYGVIGKNIIRIAGSDNLLSLFSDKKAEITAFMRNENIKTRKQGDLEKLFHYYNSL